jgi:acyl-lipid omega-6 desaturase (Delta-12 desaturase)
MIQSLREYQNYSLAIACREWLSGVGIYVLGFSLLIAMPAGEHAYLQVSWGIVAATICAFGMIKLFTVQHDCGHHAFTGKPLLDDQIGRVCSLFTLIPYWCWRSEHQRHHGAFCDLERKTLGDVFLLTIDEYTRANLIKRLSYRFFRSKVFILIFAPLIYLLVRTRAAPHGTFKDWISAISTSFVVICLYGAVLISCEKSIFFLVLAWHIAGLIAMIIFFNEHQFEHSHWVMKDQWSFEKAALNGSSVIKLPRFLDWVTGYIAYHHIHHLRPKIPSYNLRQCHLNTVHELKPTVVFPKSLLYPIGFVLWCPVTLKLVKHIDLSRR